MNEAKDSGFQNVLQGKIRPDEMYCVSCGAVIKKAAEICPQCGVRNRYAARAKDKLVAALLALFLGGLGIHKFYLGKKFQGFLYLIFCWTAIPAVIGFIECIVLLVSSQESFDRKYNSQG